MLCGFFGRQKNLKETLVEKKKKNTTETQMEMNASDQRSWYELAASRSAHQGSSLDAGSNHLLAATTSADEVDMFFPSLGDSTSNSRARQYYQQVHHAAQMHSAYNTAASHGKTFAYSIRGNLG